MRIDHAALYVKDLEAMRDFYVTYLDAVSNEGYHNPRTGLRTYFLTFAGDARLELMQRPDVNVRGENGLGYTHVAFSVGSREQVDQRTERLLAAGCQHVSGPRVTGDGYYESCVLDPEGNSLEITE